jgi:asparagine synthase (glutamine-hydrolysing)
MLDYIDEPFADSSAIAVNILSKYTREHVKVALSGDGADELFAGYNKHRAEWHIRNKSYLNFLKYCEALLEILPKSRHSPTSNVIRQMHRFSIGVKANQKERYWRWCSFINEKEADALLIKDIDSKEYRDRYNFHTKLINAYRSSEDINDILLSDVHLILPNDMLTKVDMMSMAHGLEVRNPFLDYKVVEYTFKIPSDYKLDKHSSKKILKDAFKDAFPKEILNKKKQGFEVPMLRWIQNDLKSLIDDLLNDDFIIQQNIFYPEEIKRLKQKIYSNDPGEVHAQIWGLIVFQYWWKKYLRP